MKKCIRLISHLAFPIDYSIISINRPTTTFLYISTSEITKLLHVLQKIFILNFANKIGSHDTFRSYRSIQNDCSQIFLL